MSDGEVEVVYEMIQVPSNFEMEKHLLYCLENCKKPIPSRWKEFSSFVKKKFKNIKFPREIVKSVWSQLKNLEDHLKGKVDETIEILSSDDETKGMLSPGKKKSRKNREKREEERELEEDERELERKIRNQVVLDEMLLKDQRMCQIMPSEDRQGRVEHIEQEFSKRLEKQRIDTIVSEKMKSFRKSKSKDPTEYDEEKVIKVEKSESNEENEVKTGKKRKIRILATQTAKKAKTPKVNLRLSPKMNLRVSPKASVRVSPKASVRVSPKASVSVSPKASVRVSPRERASPKESPMKRKKVAKSVTKKDEAEELRRTLLIDKLIEITLPEMQTPPKDPAEKPVAKKKKKRNSI